MTSPEFWMLATNLLYAAGFIQSLILSVLAESDSDPTGLRRWGVALFWPIVVVLVSVLWLLGVSKLRARP